MQASVVRFKRTERADSEMGIAVSHKDACESVPDFIVDSEGKQVKGLYSYQAMEFCGCFTFNPKDYL
jgi:hypothetical protein